VEFIHRFCCESGASPPSTYLAANNKSFVCSTALWIMGNVLSWSILCLLSCLANGRIECNDGVKELKLFQSPLGEAVLQNGFLCVKIQPGVIREIRADFLGNGVFGGNVLAHKGVALERETLDESDYRSHDMDAFEVLEETERKVVVRLKNVGDHVAMENWTVSMIANSRSFKIEFHGHVLLRNGGSLWRDWQFVPSSIYAWFEDSVVQMKNSPDSEPFFATDVPLRRVYALGASGKELDAVGNASIDLIFEEEPRRNIGLTSVRRTQSSAGMRSGFQQHLDGDFNGANTTRHDQWLPRLEPSPNSVLNPGKSWHHVVRVAANNFDFPVGDLDAASNMDERDLKAFMTAIYASPVGTLATHKNAVKPGLKVAQISPGLALPIRGYTGHYNFFDPDSYIATGALLWSGNAFLQDQARLVIERSGAFLSEKGRLPHHFDLEVPIYAALSKEIQTGPNLFWILSCFNYAKSSQDLEWLRGYMPVIRKASRFLLDLINRKVMLANAPGSLMIDVFLRSNYTTDTNAQFVGFFREFADAEEVLGNVTGAKRLRNLASNFEKSVNEYLWADDHYVTQWNYPENVTRDFIDYDANLIATAHGIPSEEMAKKIFARIDNGKCRTSATWVSEKYYGRRDTRDGNIGDSSCAMGRIAWFDALSRERFRDSKVFHHDILGLLVDQLLSTTFMRERLKCDGSQDLGRTEGYFEFPSTIAMMLRHIKYGVKLGFSTIEVKPFGPEKFRFALNDLLVDFDPESVSILQFPCRNGAPPRNVTYELSPMLADAMYDISFEGNSLNDVRASSEDAILRFEAPVGVKISVSKKPFSPDLQEETL